MARMAVKTGTEFSRKLEQFGRDAPKVAERVVMAGAGPVADEIRKGLVENLKDPSYVGKLNGQFSSKKNVPTGDLLESFGVAPPGHDKRGNTNTKIGFEGYDRKGVPNAMKARAMESGTSTLRKRPFVSPAVKRMRTRAIAAMEQKLEEEMKIYSL